MEWLLPSPACVFAVLAIAWTSDIWGDDLALKKVAEVCHCSLSSLRSDSAVTVSDVVWHVNLEPDFDKE